MNVSKSPVSLISIELNQKSWHRLFHLIVVFEDPINGFWDIVHDHIQIYFVWLCKATFNHLIFAYLVTLCVESMLESNHIRVEEFLHYLKLSIFIALILVNFLDCNDFTGLCDSCLRESVLM